MDCGINTIVLCLVLFFFSLILDFQEAAEAALSKIGEDDLTFYAGNVTSSKRRLAQSNIQPGITITKGRYYNDILGVKSLEIRFSISEAAWKSIRCYLRGPSPSSWSFVRTVLQKWNPCPSVLNITSFAHDGYYTFTVKGVPASEADTVSATSRWIIDHTPPQTYIYSACNRQCPKNRKTFRFSASDKNKVDRYQCKLDYGQWFSCKSPYTLQIADHNTSENHTFHVRAVDEAGNIDPVGSSHSWYSNNGSAVVRYLSYGTTSYGTPEGYSYSSKGYSYSSTRRRRSSSGRRRSSKLPVWAVVVICLSPFLSSILLFFCVYFCVICCCE